MAQQGDQALAAKAHPGSPPRLSDDQLRQLQALLLQGATQHGWPNELWTGKRVAEMIRRHFGVSLHPDHVVRMLRQRLHWTSPKPQRRARQRNDKGYRTALSGTVACVPRIPASGREWPKRGTHHVLGCTHPGFRPVCLCEELWSCALA